VCSVLDDFKTMLVGIASTHIGGVSKASHTSCSLCSQVGSISYPRGTVNEILDIHEQLSTYSFN
jgi:hypothetical protein